MVRRLDRRKPQPLVGLKILDVGCGGGLLSEARTQSIRRCRHGKSTILAEAHAHWRLRGLAGTLSPTHHIGNASHRVRELNSGGVELRFRLLTVPQTVPQAAHVS